LVCQQHFRMGVWPHQLVLADFLLAVRNDCWCWR